MDISPSFPDVVYNFNIIPKNLLDIMKNGNCRYYFNDVKTVNNSALCDETWDKINDLASGLNWYDLFRKVYPDSGLLL
jgi:hypothetical protein